MIVETLRLLHSQNWYGCSDTIELAKGQNAIPKTWKETRRKLKRKAFMQAGLAANQVKKKSIIKKISSWLLSRK